MISNASVALLNRSHEEVQIVVEVKDVPSAYLSAYNAAVDGKKQLIRVPKQIPLVKGLPFMTHVSIRMDELNIRHAIYIIDRLFKSNGQHFTLDTVPDGDELYNLSTDQLEHALENYLQRTGIKCVHIQRHDDVFTFTSIGPREGLALPCAVLTINSFSSLLVPTQRMTVDPRAGMLHILPYQDVRTLSQLFECLYQFMAMITHRFHAGQPLHDELAIYHDLVPIMRELRVTPYSLTNRETHQNLVVKLNSLQTDIRELMSSDVDDLEVPQSIVLAKSRVTTLPGPAAPPLAADVQQPAADAVAPGPVVQTAQQPPPLTVTVTPPLNDDDDDDDDEEDEDEEDDTEPPSLDAAAAAVAPAADPAVLQPPDQTPPPAQEIPQQDTPIQAPDPASIPDPDPATPAPLYMAAILPEVVRPMRGDLARETYLNETSFTSVYALPEDSTETFYETQQHLPPPTQSQRVRPPTTVGITEPTVAVADDGGSGGVISGDGDADGGNGSGDDTDTLQSALTTEHQQLETLQATLNEVKRLQEGQKERLNYTERMITTIFRPHQGGGGHIDATATASFADYLYSLQGPLDTEIWESLTPAQEDFIMFMLFNVVDICAFDRLARRYTHYLKARQPDKLPYIYVQLFDFRYDLSFLDPNGFQRVHRCVIPKIKYDDENYLYVDLEAELNRVSVKLTENHVRAILNKTVGTLPKYAKVGNVAIQSTAPEVLDALKSLHPFGQRIALKDGSGKRKSDLGLHFGAVMKALASVGTLVLQIRVVQAVVDSDVRMINACVHAYLHLMSILNHARTVNHENLELYENAVADLVALHHTDYFMPTDQAVDAAPLLAFLPGLISIGREVYSTINQRVSSYLGHAVDDDSEEDEDEDEEEEEEEEEEEQGVSTEPLVDVSSTPSTITTTTRHSVFSFRMPSVGTTAQITAMSQQLASSPSDLRTKPGIVVSKPRPFLDSHVRPEVITSIQSQFTANLTSRLETFTPQEKPSVPPRVNPVLTTSASSAVTLTPPTPKPRSQAVEQRKSMKAQASSGFISHQPTKFKPLKPSSSASSTSQSKTKLARHNMYLHSDTSVRRSISSDDRELAEEEHTYFRGHTTSSS